MSGKSNGGTFGCALLVVIDCNHSIKKSQDLLSPAEQSESSLFYAMNCQKFEVAYSEYDGSLSLGTTKAG